MFNEKNRKRFAREMFNELEKNIIIMALMYFKNDYTDEDLDDLGMPDLGQTVEETTHHVIEDLIGPTWDEEATAISLEETQKRMKR
tara:strand:+ start:380 stop:637 length:258 start_codon:yes stop_codon:yes gene_type:complete